MVPSANLLDIIAAKYPSLVKAPVELNETARSWHIPGFKGSFGFISSMSDHFCASCNRLRITADGQIKAGVLCVHRPWSNTFSPAGLLI